MQSRSHTLVSFDHPELRTTHAVARRNPLRATRGAVAVALVLAATQLGLQCSVGGVLESEIVILSPAAEQNAADCIHEISFELVGGFDPATLDVTLNFAPLAVSNGGAGNIYSAGLGAQLQAENLLLVKAQRTSDSQTVTTGRSFDYLPVRAYQITDEADLITGPLAHGRVGDYMLSNCTARFVVQDVAQRDLYSVGGYGGNLIDLELLSDPGKDNFIEITPTIDVETVVNAQTIEIVNDGSNGQPAEIRTCGPDDLLDFINPSSQLVGIPGVAFPFHADDLDLNVEACTVYSLALHERWVKMETTVTNNGFFDLALLVGDWINAGGEVENLFTPGDGPGSGLTADHDAISWFGYGDATGIDYGYTTIPLPEDTDGRVASFLNTNGVTLVLHNVSVLDVILGGTSPFFVAGGGDTKSYTRYLGVGDGAPSNAIDMANELKGTSKGTVKGCVTVEGAPAEGARVTIGTLDAGSVDEVLTILRTDSTGCYEGSVRISKIGETFAMAAALAGHPYAGGAADPPLLPFELDLGETEIFPIVDLPAAGALHVEIVDENGSPIPARVTVVGFDPSAEPILPGSNLFGLSVGERGLFRDPSDDHPYGVSRASYAEADGVVEFTIEPGTYEIYASRGTEYSLFRERHTVTAGTTTNVNAEITRVLETPGFVSSDFHVHGINSADSQVSHADRVRQFAGEGVENVVMTDHHVHTDLTPHAAALGMEAWVTGTIGEEITTFDYGHFNGYPFTIDPNVPSGGSTDWAQPAPPGMDFPQYGNLNATPPEIYALATTGARALPATVVQVNHIGSHFGPLKIDTTLVPITDGLTPTEREDLRLPTSGNLFHAFDALELWNGDSRGAQSSFLNERMGIWFNHLNQGLPTTFIADTDTHKFLKLNASGARTWTASPTDAPELIDPSDVGGAIATGRAVGGQGIYVLTRLLAADGSNGVADLTLSGSTETVTTNGDVDLEINIQAPLWAGYDKIEIYANAATVPVDAANPYAYGAVPVRTVTAFDVDEVLVDPGVPNGSRFETVDHIESFPGLTEDTWFVVVVSGTQGTSPPMFPIYPSNISSAENPTLDDLAAQTLVEDGVRALGATNALWVDADGVPGIQMLP